MKAIRVTQHGGPEVLEYVDVPDLKPGPGEVLIRVKAAGVNPVDTYLRSGAYTNAKIPYTPGFDAAGIVESIGSGVADVAVGARVYTSATLSGAYAEFTLAKQETVHPFPEGISFSQAASLNIPYATAYRALFQKARARAGEKLLIHGASGGVGIAAIQWARAAGLTIFGSAGSGEGLKLIQDEGVHHPLDHRKPDYLEELKSLTKGAGVNIILEMLANVNLSRDLNALAMFGRVVVIGSRGPIEISPRDTMSKDATVLGMTLFNAPSKDLQIAHAAIYGGLKSGLLKPVVSSEYPLKDAPKAHVEILEAGSQGKIVLIP
ncbi:MAG: NADPH:quinone reductase [Verrucomicrobiales bacterium]